MKTMHDQEAEQDHQEAAQTLFQEGLSCWKIKKIDRALHLFQKAHEMHPGNLLISSYLGLSLAKAGINRQRDRALSRSLKEPAFQRGFAL